MRLSILKDFFIACCVEARNKEPPRKHHTISEEREKVKIWEEEITHLENVYEGLVKKKEISEDKEEAIVAKLQALKEHLDRDYLSKMQPNRKVTKRRVVVRKKKAKR